MNRHSQRGSAVLEFAFTGIPLIFIWISVAQMALGMWNYHTMQYAMKTTGAYLMMHGSDYCVNNSGNCTIGNIAQVFANNANGLPRASVYMTFTPVSGTDHTTAGTATSCWLNSCLTNSTTWPVSGYDTPGQEFTIRAEYQYHSGAAMVAPGSGAPVSFGPAWFPAFTHQVIVY